MRRPHLSSRRRTIVWRCAAIAAITAVFAAACTTDSDSSEPAPERGQPVAAGSSLRGEGYRINFGTSFVMTVDYTGAEPAAWALLVYGQSDDRTLPLSDVQTEAFSNKIWRQVAFTDEQIEADPELDTYTVIGR